MSFCKIKRSIILLVAVLAMYFIMSQSFYTINQQDRGIVLRNGKLLTEALPGPGWKLPFIDKVTRISMQRNLVYWNKFQVITSTLDVMELEISVIWHVAPFDVVNMYKKYNSLEAVENILIIPRVTEQVRLLSSNYSTEQVLNHREKFAKTFSTTISSAVEGPVIIDSIYIGSIHMQTISLD